MAGQLANQTSSVGAAWPPAIGTHERLRGFYEETVQNEAETQAFTEQFEAFMAEAQETPEISRLSIRLLAGKQAIRALDVHGITIEGALPINDELAIVYTAANAPDRRASGERLAAHRTLLDTTARGERRSLDALHAKHGHKLHLIDSATPQKAKQELVKKFVGLYSMFGYDEGDVRELLDNPANTIAYIEDDEGIVSTAMAEQATIQIAGFGDVRIAEITEAATREKDQGKGLYTIVSSHLVTELGGRLLQPHVVYGESNLTKQNVITAAHNNGRNFSFHDRDRFGIAQQNFGILQQNFKVEDGKEVRPYNDFALTYFPTR